MLDLQARVDLEEGRAARRRVVEELGGAGAAVAHRGRQAHGRGLQRRRVLGRQHRRGRLFDHLLVAPLQRAVALAEGVHDRRAGRVGGAQQLHLDVARRVDAGLEQHAAAPERARHFGAHGVERGGQRRGRLDAPDAAPAPARRRLHHQRIAHRRGRVRPGRRIGVVQRAPGRQRHRRRLGQPLGGDLVAQRAHGRRVGADEGDARRLEAGDELGVLGDEAPAGPHGVDARRAQVAQHPVVVAVGGDGPAGGVHAVGGPQIDRLVGQAHEGRAGVGRGEEGHRDQVEVAGAGVGPQGAQTAHGGLAPVEDRDAVQRLHSAVSSATPRSSTT